MRSTVLSATPGMPATRGCASTRSMTLRPTPWPRHSGATTTSWIEACSTPSEITRAKPTSRLPRSAASTRYEPAMTRRVTSSERPSAQ